MSDAGVGAQKLHEALSNLQQGRMGPAGIAAAQALDAFKSAADPTGEAASHQVLAMVAAAAGEYGAAVAHVDAAIPLREATGDHEGVASLWQERFELCLRDGDLPGARLAMERQHGAHTRAGDREGAAHALHQLAQILLQEGEDVRAEELVQQALFDLEGPQGARGRSALQLLYANIWAVRSDPERSMRHAREGLELARQAKFRPGEIDALQQIGTLHGAVREWPAARRALEEALMGRELLKDLEGRAHVLRELAGVEFATGDLDAAFERLDYAVRSVREANNFVGEVTLLQLLQQAADEHDRADVALRAGEDMLHAAERTGDVEAVAAAHFALGSRLAGTADLDGARSHFGKAHDIQRQLGLAHESAVSQGMLGQVVYAMGDVAEGKRLMQASLLALDGLGSEAADTVRQILAELEAEA